MHIHKYNTTLFQLPESSRHRRPGQQHVTARQMPIMISYAHTSSSAYPRRQP